MVKINPKLIDTTEFINNSSNNLQDETYSCDFLNKNAIINSYSNQEDGYIKMANGLMIQWGNENLQRTATNQQELQINFPTTFSAIYTCVASSNDPGYGVGELNEGIGVITLTNSNFTILFKSLTNVAHPITIRWIAIGKWN